MTRYVVALALLTACDPEEVDDMSTSAEEVDDRPDVCAPPAWDEPAHYTCESPIDWSTCLDWIWPCSQGSQAACLQLRECYPTYHAVTCLCDASWCARGDTGACASCTESCAPVDSSWDPEPAPAINGLSYEDHARLCRAG